MDEANQSETAQPIEPSASPSESTSPGSAGFTRLMFCLTILIGAYLLFQIQPLVGKIATQQFGGVASVWCVCLMFFQGVLLGGYSLTYLLAKLPLKKQCWIFATAALAAAAFALLLPQAQWD
ncbi:MAG TPA: hypothetical protein V6C72_03715, partial [Chroococcales cyanobacterium]